MYSGNVLDGFEFVAPPYEQTIVVSAGIADLQTSTKRQITFSVLGLKQAYKKCKTTATSLPITGIHLPACWKI